MKPQQLATTTVARDTFREEVIDGLRRTPKRIPCKYLYDERGARLFERICELEEYYPTRTELSIMNRYIGEMAACLGRRCQLIEYGSGSGLKTHILLKAMEDPVGYVPIDIAGDQLAVAAARLRTRFPTLEVLPLCADYTGHYELPRTRRAAARRVVYFPGSTIGNFDPEAATDFLRHISAVCGQDGGLLIGVDLKKDKSVLERAYNDTAQVTAAFNLNLLRRINRELDADCDIAQFRHRAQFNEDHGRIEIHLVSTCRQSFRIDGVEFAFVEGATIHTENSYKYTTAEFARLAKDGGYRVARVWSDDDALFSVQYLVTD